MTYYNTTKLQGDELGKVEVITSQQDKQILKHFSNNPEKEYTSHDVENYFNYPRSSIVRSMNTLEKHQLIKKVKKVDGKYGLSK